MALVVDVPLNTMLADLDETLRVLLKRELGRHGFDGVEVAFDAPARDWSSQLSGPTVNLFLYDLRESHEFRPTEWRTDRSNGRHREVRPPMMMECSYAVTAWTQAVEDEHRLLSQVLGVLFAFPQLPGRRARRPARRDRAALRDRGPDRAAEVRRQGRLLDGGRRPVQGVARLRRHARVRVRHRLRARAGGADADDRRRGIARRPARRRSPRCTASAARCVDADGAPLRRRLGHAARPRAVRRRRTARAASCSTACRPASTSSSRARATAPRRRRRSPCPARCSTSPSAPRRSAPAKKKGG